MNVDEETKFWDNFKAKVTATPQASIDFLHQLGVLTKKGNITKAYKHLTKKTLK